MANEDYIHAQKIFEEFKFKNLDEYLIYMAKVIHYCLVMYLKRLKMNVLKHRNLILLIFYLQLD